MLYPVLPRAHVDTDAVPEICSRRDIVVDVGARVGAREPARGRRWYSVWVTEGAEDFGRAVVNAMVMRTSAQ